MVGAVCLKLNEKQRARLYLVGTYNNIDWDIENPSELGEEYACYAFKAGVVQQPAISVAKGLDGEYILRLVETKRYILKLEDDTGDSIALPKIQNEGNKNLKCDKDKDSVTFQFVNYLGRSKMDFIDADTTLSFEVVPDKMNYEDDYIKLTEALADVCSELLLDYAGATSNVYSISEDSRKTLLEQFIFLRKFCYSENIMGLFEAIKRNPDRVLDQEEELKPFGTGMPSKKFYRNPFSYSRGWKNVGNTDDGHGIFAPEMVAVTQKFDRLDTPANRFVKYALHKFDSICTELINALETAGQSEQTECLNEAKAIHKSLEIMFRDSFFDDVGELDIMPQNNQVLQKRQGYSQLFAAYSMLDLALQLNWQGKDDVYEGESKNVALLYEYWLFFELYKIVKSIDGAVTVKTEEDPFLLVEDGLTISLEEGKKSCQSFEIEKYGVKINLYYNRTFSRTEFKTTMYEGSYSRPFRPDYTLAVFPKSFTKGRYNGEEEAIASGAVSYIHFDAKYRITDLTSLIGDIKDSDPEEEISEDKIGSVVNTYKRGDLLKMHTYNDAIRRTVGSYVLYPGAYSVSKAGNETFRLYDEILPGVGAFSIKPSIGVMGENELRTFIVSLIESGEAKNSRLNRLKYYTEMILREPSISKVNSVAQTSGPMKQGDMFVIGYIRDEQNGYYGFLEENGLLKKDSEFLFYFYAISGKDVYSHHKDIFKAQYFRFYKNEIEATDSYKLEPVLCTISSNELISKSELVSKLRDIGYETTEEEHSADFYYVLKVKVEDDQYSGEELKVSEVNAKNGNDTFSPHSPKVLYV